MTRRLTSRERSVLIEHIARELCWAGSSWEHEKLRKEAGTIIDALTRDAIQAATLKRSIDRVIEGGLTNEGAA